MSALQFVLLAKSSHCQVQLLFKYLCQFLAHYSMQMMSMQWVPCVLEHLLLLLFITSFSMLVKVLTALHQN